MKVKLFVEGIKNGNGKEYLDIAKLFNDDNYKSILQQKRENEYYKIYLENKEKIKKIIIANGNKKLTFEGEYINGAKSKGIIKNYNIYGLLILECEYIEGEIKGNAIEYWNNEIYMISYIWIKLNYLKKN